MPSLLDDQGYLPRTTIETVQRAKEDEVEIELRAQIDAALAAGIDVTHLDSHMGTVMFPKFLPIYARLALDYQLPVFAFHPDDAVLEARGMRGYGPFVHRLVSDLEAAGIPAVAVPERAPEKVKKAAGHADGNGHSRPRRVVVKPRQPAPPSSRAPERRT